MPLADRVKVESYFTEDERTALSDQAKRLHLSRAEFIRRVALGIPIPSYGKQEAILNLMKMNSDLARLGNLMKLALDNIEVDGLAISTGKITQIMAQIQDTQTTLKQKIQEL